MRESVAVVHDLVSRFAPVDELGAEHRASALAWLASTDDVFRRVKPASPAQHLVSYVVPVAADGRILLVDHVNAGLWVSPGGHVEIDEDPAQTARREIREELGLSDAGLARSPIFLTITPPVGQDHDHTDVSLWYVLACTGDEELRPDGGEFHAVRWWTRDELAAADPGRFDPHLFRFLTALDRDRLVNELHRRTGLENLSGGTDRFGKVPAILFTPFSGHISVRVGCGEGYEVIVWAYSGEPAAVGRTGDLDEIAGTLRDGHEGRSAGELAERHTYLAVTDPPAAIEALWHVLTAHHEDGTMRIAHAAAANPVLRRVWPWISHGTLHLYDLRDRPSLVKRGLAFHPAAGGFMVGAYDGELHAAEPAETAIVRAADIVASWQD
ncbi:NUDIX domain-containing protein [Catenuloplanes sp. NPDC051500]|uniref:NUDIX domain-containing protein n=1 Tax=Catenuloplanes sp. NPDC051500 TaxID=3363959 RepID=UPI0037B2D163